MSESAPKKPWVWLGLVAVCFACFSLLGLQPPVFTSHAHAQPLHADEAVQWSRALELSEGIPYSSNEDRFHGPTLALTLWAASKVTKTAFIDMSETYLRNIAGCYLVLLSLYPLQIIGSPLPVEKEIPAISSGFDPTSSPILYRFP